jgi:SAM-dependent methyltransferase
MGVSSMCLSLLCWRTMLLSRHASVSVGSTEMDVDTREGPRLGDAFGATLLACLESGLRPGTVQAIVERDDGYLDGQDALSYFLPAEQWDALDHWLVDRAAGHALDVGAGAGRVALHLQNEGHAVTALDISPAACEVCRRRGVRTVVEGTVFELPESPLDAQFDSVLMLGNNLGLLESRRHAPLLLGALATRTRPGAVILGRGRDPYATENPLHLRYHARNEVLGRMGGQVRIRIRYQDMATPYFDYLFTTADELHALLKGTAWTLEEYEQDGSGYGVVLRKKER